MWWRNPDDPTKPISRLVIHDSEPSYSFPGVTTWFSNSQVLIRDHSTHLPAPTLGSLNTHVLTQFSRSTICPISNKIPHQSSSILFLCTLSNLHPSHGSLLYFAREAHRHGRSSLRIALNWTKKCYCTSPHHGKADTFASTSGLYQDSQMAERHDGAVGVVIFRTKSKVEGGGGNTNCTTYAFAYSVVNILRSSARYDSLDLKPNTLCYPAGLTRLWWWRDSIPTHVMRKS
jgi:hypothetical protein